VIDRLPTSGKVLVAAAPLVLALLLASFAWKGVQETGPGKFCREVTVLTTTLTEGKRVDDPTHDPAAVLRQVEEVDLDALIDSLPDDLARTGDVIRRDVPRFVRRLRAMRRGQDVRKAIPHDLAVAATTLATAYGDSCRPT
jgi:hypothetical protein